MVEEDDDDMHVASHALEKAYNKPEKTKKKKGKKK